MKRLLGSIALATALGLGASAAHAQMGNEDWGWNDDNWASDDYGYYDEDFAWESDDGFLEDDAAYGGDTGFGGEESAWGEDQAFDDWYADSDNDWNGFYDDVGDEGLFDV